jgi:hypothetical protein
MTVISKPLSEQDELRLLRNQQRDLTADGRQWAFYCSKPGLYRVTLAIGPDGLLGLRFESVDQSEPGNVIFDANVGSGAG